MINTSTSWGHRCFRSPNCWVVLLAQGGLWFLARLPFRMHPPLAYLFGKILQFTMRRRRHIVEVNLQLCFPEKSPDQIIALRDAHFKALGFSLIEAALAWWGPLSRLQGRATLHGIEHLQRVHASGRGAILLAAHYTTLEIWGTFAGTMFPLPFRTVFRPHENSWLDWVVTRRRGRVLGSPIARDNIREMVRALRRQEVVWFASDQNYGLKHSVFSPFFSIPAATNTALSRIAAITGAAVLPFACRRLTNGTYELTIEPPLEGFPSADLQADTDRVNRIIEAQVRLAPEQYWWVHRRFKDRPPGQKDVYAIAQRTT